MSSTIQGSKSINYNKEDIDGIPLSGDYMQHMSVQEVAGKRGAADVVIHGTTVVSTGHTILANSVRRKIVATAHGAKQGWIMRPMSGNSNREEIAIVKIVDANTFIISTEFDMAIGDTFDILRPVTPNYTDSGDLYVSVSGSGPVQFIKDSATVTVTEDTAVPANNLGLPSKMFIEIDGVVYPVRKDTGTPSNTVSVPVELSGVAGPVNITAGDLNVQLTDLGANFDRTRIGDGTNQLGINASSEALVHDTDALVELTQINSGVDTLANTVQQNGSAISGVNTVGISGSDGTNARSIKTDTTGRLEVVTTSQAQTATFVSDATVSTTPETFIAPAGAFAALIETDDTNLTNARVVMGGVSSTTTGIQFQGGRSELYQGGSNISYCMESGTGKISVQWFIRT